MQTLIMAMKLLLPCLLVGFASQGIADPSITRTSDGRTANKGDLIFVEDFNVLNLSLWQYEKTMGGGGNGEFQMYSDNPANAYVRDGILYIKPTLSLDTLYNGNYETFYNGYSYIPGCTDEAGQGSNSCQRQAQYPWINNPVVSSRLRTKGAFAFTYGRVEVRAQMPSGDWTWPAIWMLPEKLTYGVWPASGEIDIVESRGNRNLTNTNGVNIGSEQAGSTLHFGPKWPYDAWWAGHGETNTASGQGFDRDFHLYGVEWTDSYITFTIDGKVLSTTKFPDGGSYQLGYFPADDTTNVWASGNNNFRTAPFDQHFHMILNVAVGGNYFPKDSKPSPPWGNTPFLDFFNSRDQWLSTWSEENAAMKVDYIKIYAV